MQEMHPDGWHQTRNLDISWNEPMLMADILCWKQHKANMMKTVLRRDQNLKSQAPEELQKGKFWLDIMEKNLWCDGG